MEDEECLPENSSFKLYLQNLGFSDLQVIKNIPQKQSNISLKLSKPKFKWPYIETIDEDVIDQISIIVSTRMLFEEDIANVEKLLSNFKVVKNGMLKNMFKDLFGVVVIFFGLCLYWVIGHYAFFIVSTFYAFSAAEYLSHKYFSQKQLKKLMSILQANFTLLKKTVKFIEENNLIEANNACKIKSKEYMEGFEFYKNFKFDFLMSVNEMINILIKSTQKLIDKVPLYDYIENPEFYLCNNFNKNYDSISLSKLYEIYLLVQSEFLQRLILSLIPNIKLKTKDGFHEINKILTETCVNLLRIKNKLNKKFKFIFLNGVHSPKSKVEFKLPLKNKSENNYLKEFFLNIHEITKNFQNLLLKSRIIEDNLDSNEIPEHVEQELIKMESDLIACQRNLTDSIILLKRAKTVKENSDKCDNVKLQDEMENSIDITNRVMVGYTDLDPKTEDEIFEAYFTNENCAGNFSDNADWDFDDRLERRLAKDYCKTVIKELKLKLVEKAEYWEKKEKELLKKKGIIDMNENDLEDKKKTESPDEDVLKKPDSPKFLKCQNIFENSHTNSVSDFNDQSEKISEKSENEDEQEKNVDNFPAKCQEKFQVSQASCTDSKIFEIEVNDNTAENSSSEISQGSCIREFNKSFLNDLNQARQKIFNSSFAAEDLFFTSEET